MKTSAFELAVFGGSPLFARPLHVGQPVLLNPQEMLTDFDRVLHSGQLTNNGPRLKDFEAAVCRVTATRHCIATCNATIALQIAARALKLTGEVIMPAFTFIATAHAMEWIGLEPVFADVDAHTHTLNPDSVASCITSRTSAVLPVHLWGHVCRTDELRTLCVSRGLRLLYDSSHAFGCQHNGIPVGSFGDAEVFSFHATKFVHAFEGGAIVTNDDQLAERCRRLRAFGICGLTEISDVGTNGKMHELSAVAGLHSIATMSQRIVANAEHRQTYAGQCHEVPGLSLLSIPDGDVSNGQYLVVEVDETVLGLTRDQLVSILRAEGVFARSYFSPGCHRAEPYRSAVFRHVRVPLPVTESLASSVLQLPTGPSVSTNDILTMGRLLKFIHRCSSDIRQMWVASEGRQGFHAADPARPADIGLRDLNVRDSVLKEAG